MTRKIISWLPLWAVFLFTLSSCVHDEVYSASDPESGEYTNKSLWKEDEVYIKNVQQIFSANANLENFRSRHHGLPVWDYAMTFGSFDESYLMVPISGKNGIKEVMIVERKNDKVFFSTSDDTDASHFFRNLIFKNNGVAGIKSQIEENARMMCKTRTYTLCFGNPNGSQSCYPNEVTTCVQQNELGDNEMGNGGGGIDYPSGGGGGNNSNEHPQDPPNPCEKTKSILNKPNVQAGINNVTAQALSTLSNANAGEIGFKEKKDGTIVPANVSAAHHVIFNDVTDSYGGYHNHTALGTHMFSPPDIDALFGFAAAQSIQDGVGNAYLGMIAAEWCNCPPNNQQFLNYVITYTGTGTELGGYTYTAAQMNQFIIDYQKVVSNLTNQSKSGTTYIKNSGDLNEKGLEKLFFETLKIMNLSGKVNLQRIESNGNVYNVNLDINGIPVGTPCP